MDEDFVDFANPIEQSGMDMDTCALLDAPCQSSPCSNGATCIGAGDSFQCRCPVRFSGELCEEGLCNVTVRLCVILECFASVCVCMYVHVVCVLCACVQCVYIVCVCVCTLCVCALCMHAACVCPCVFLCLYV